MKAVKYLLLIVMCTFSISSCALNKEDVKQGKKDEIAPQPADRVFYKLQEGKVFAVGKKGEKIPLRRVELPFKHDIKAVKSIETLTIIKLEGSNIELICPSPFYCFTY